LNDRYYPKVTPRNDSAFSPIAILSIARSKENWKLRDAGREQLGDMKMQNEKKRQLKIYWLLMTGSSPALLRFTIMSGLRRNERMD